MGNASVRAFFMNTKLSFTFILITLALDAIGIGLMFPILPQLILEVNGGALGNAAIWGGILATSFAVMQFLFSPMVGSLSDRFGRRPVLLVSLSVMALDYVIMALAGTIWWLLIGRIIGGIAASTQATATAFIADISEPEDKAKNFGLVGAAFGVGFVIGPLLGGLLGEYGTRVPFWTAAVLATANAILGYIVLPETVTDRIRRPFDLRRANPFGAFKAMGKLPGLRRFLFLAFLFEFAFSVYPMTWAYFTQERFGWGTLMIGVSLASFGISMAFVQGALIRLYLKRLGEAGTVVFGLLFNMVAFLCFAFVASPTVALVMTPLTALGAVTMPALQGMMSRIAKDDQQGELQGILSSFRSVAYIVAPLILTQTFAYFTLDGAPLYLPGAAFLLSALTMALCAAVFMTRPKAELPI